MKGSDMDKASQPQSTGEPKPEQGEGSEPRKLRWRLGPRFLLLPDSKFTVDLTTPEGGNVLNRLLNLTADDPSTIFRKAPALYQVALEANKHGKAVGVAPSADALETEFVGF
jgi:hypothetical protein